MSIEHLQLIGHASLWDRSQTIRDPRAPEIAELEARLAATLDGLRNDQAGLRSLSAPQIGISLRMCRIFFFGKPEPVTLINPWVVEASLESTDEWEECASIPHLRFELRRFQRTTVEYVDMAGSGRSIVSEGTDAALLQHEIDHFNGFLLTDRLHDSKKIEHRFANRSKGKAQESADHRLPKSTLC